MAEVLIDWRETQNELKMVLPHTRISMELFYISYNLACHVDSLRTK